MKTICLVVCLMLARDIAGSIFRPQFDPRLTNLVAQPLELLGDQQTIERYQRHQHQDQKHHHPRHQYSAETSRSQDSKESKESKESGTYDDTNNDYRQTPNSAINAWNSALYYNVIEQADDKQRYGDVIAWRDSIVDVPAYPVNNQKDYERSSIFYDAFITMKHMSDEEKQRFHEAYQTAVRASNEDVKLTAPQMLKKHQYEVEEHTVKTDDGYLLTVFRIPAKQQREQGEHGEQKDHKEQREQKEQRQQKGHRDQKEQREQTEQREQREQKEQRQDQSQESSEVHKAPVVFLMHGLLGSADDWLLMGPGKSLAYQLSDAGYDVWLGNARGNKYSRRHVSKHPAQNDFWQFSTDEIALHDLPAMIDYTLNKTQQQKLVYVGHSQGTTAFFALASAKPEYKDKISMMHAISPMAYMSNARSPLLRMIAATQQVQGGPKDRLFGDDKFNPNKILINLAGGNMCEYKIGCKDVCSNVNFVMTGVNPENVDVSLIPVIMNHLPAGASIRQMKQYGQAVASNEFRKYNYGSEINEKIYGQPEPPKYDMTKVDVPVALYYSDNDWLAHPKDVERLRQDLPNVRDAYRVPAQQFTHTDFQFSKKAPEVVYKRLIETIKKNQE